MPDQSVRLRAKIKAKRCAHCDRMFTKEEHLKRHERSHTGEKPFSCHKCNKKYARSDVLARHLQTHPDETVVGWPRTNAAERSPSGRPVRANDLDEQRSRSSDMNRHARNDLLVSEHQGFVMPLEEQQIGMPLGEIHWPASQRNDLGQPPSMHGADDSITVALPQTTQPQQAQISSEPRNLETSRSASSHPWRDITHDGMSGTSLQDWFLSAGSPTTANQSISRLDHAADKENIHAVHPLHSVEKTPTQNSPWPIMHDEGTLLSQPAGCGPLEQLAVQEPNQSTLQSSTMHSSNALRLSSQPAGAGRYETSPYMFETDFAAYSYMSPGIDFLDFATPCPALSNTPQLPNGKDSSPEILFSVDQVERMRQIWRGRRTISNVRMIRSFWHSVVQHDADNIFSRQQCAERDQLEPVSKRPRISRWGVDDECRERLCAYCKKLDDDIGGEDQANLTPHSTSGASDTDACHGSSLSLSLVGGFPTREVLDASLDLFFQCSHLPFIQKATFDAKTVPEPLLLAIHLVGLSSLYPERSRSFVLQNQKKLMRFCRSDLTSKVAGHCQPWEVLVAVASALLVVYLALGHLEQLDEDQAHMLCVQMLHIAEKHGLFAASDGDDPTSQLQAGPADSEGSWKAWCRVESINRMISCLLWMDMAYARIMGGAGVLEIDKVELHLPCEIALFEAPTSNRYYQIARHQTQVRMPPMRVQNFHTDPSPKLNHMSMETLLVALYLQIAAIRHGLPIGSHRSYPTRSIISDKEFSTDGRTKDVIESLLSLPWGYADLFRQRHRVTAFAWNNVCIAVTADLNLLEIASGRDGLDAARTAMLTVSKWSRTARARRATLHAAQIFDILSSSRLSEWNIARPDLLLFQSGLVLSMYLFVCDQREDNNDGPAFELLQNIDWTAVGHEGLRSPTQTMSPSPSLDGQCSSDAADGARDFIRRGGPLTFSGEVLSGGGVTARKILLNYVHLLDDIGKYRGSSYSQILKTMSDFVIEGNQ